MKTIDEILLSKDKTISIIDGSGVVHDPLGLDRTEMIRLAHGRLMISHFDSSKLGPDGYKILCEDRDFILPCKFSSPLFCETEHS
jgi:glutamate dehydrogenase